MNFKQFLSEVKLFSDYTVHKSKEFDGSHRYEVRHKGKIAGFSTLDTGNKKVFYTIIKPEHQRKGVATALYKHIEKGLGHPLEPSDQHTAMGKAFRGKYEARRTITEMFDSHYPYTKTYEKKGLSYSFHEYSFRTPNDKYHVRIDNNEQTKRMNVSFHNNAGSQGISGKEGKNSHRIFGTIQHIMNNHAEEHDIKHARMYGAYDAEGRNKLYTHILKNKPKYKAQDVGDGIIHTYNVVNEVSHAGLDSIRKMISDPSTPHHEREAARHALHKLGHSEKQEIPKYTNWLDDIKSRKTYANVKPKPRKPKINDIESIKRGHKMASDMYYKKQYSTEPDETHEHYEHHYKDHRGHKIELHSFDNKDVHHWYHITPDHKATKGSGLDNLKSHLWNNYVKNENSQPFHIDHKKHELNEMKDSNGNKYEEKALSLDKIKPPLTIDQSSKFHINKWRRRIKNNEHIEPITVLDQGGKYDVVDGNHRYHAHSLEGKETINTHVYKSSKLKENTQPFHTYDIPKKFLREILSEAEDGQSHRFTDDENYDDETNEQALTSNENLQYIQELTKKLVMKYLNKAQDRPERMFSSPDKTLKSYTLAQKKLGMAKNVARIKAIGRINESIGEDKIHTNLGIGTLKHMAKNIRSKTMKFYISSSQPDANMYSGDSQFYTHHSLGARASQIQGAITHHPDTDSYHYQAWKSENGKNVEASHSRLEKMEKLGVTRGKWNSDEARVEKP